MHNMENPRVRNGDHVPSASDSLGFSYSWFPRHKNGGGGPVALHITVTGTSFAHSHATWNRVHEKSLKSWDRAFDLPFSPECLQAITEESPTPPGYNGTCLLQYDDLKSASQAQLQVGALGKKARLKGTGWPGQVYKASGRQAGRAGRRTCPKLYGKPSV